MEEAGGQEGLRAHKEESSLRAQCTFLFFLVLNVLLHYKTFKE